MKIVFIRIPKLATFSFLFAMALAWPAETHAKNLSFIRDAEIENIIRAYATPLFAAAGLDPSAVDIYLVKDKTLNAFVASGQKLFINTGLLLQSKHAGQVIGVIAHETGHIAGGHLSRVHNAMKKTSAQSILAMVIGGAAAIASKRGDVGAAVMMGGQSMNQRNLFQYTRTQESSADQAAQKFLESTDQSTRGLLEFMEVLADQELLSARHQDPYLRTHPMARERIEALQAFISSSPNADTPVTPRFAEMHGRMKAKLYAFINSFAATLRLYKESDSSLYSRYARAVAHYRVSDMDKALALIDGLIAEQPDDPYFRELKGQMLFEKGRVAESLEPYGNAVRMLPRSALLRLGLARAQLETNDPALLDSAVANLRAAVQKEPESSFTWRQLAIAHGRKGEMGLSSLAMAEEALLMGKKNDAVYHANRAEKLLPKGSMGWLQTQDILNQAQMNKKKK